MSWRHNPNPILRAIVLDIVGTLFALWIARELRAALSLGADGPGVESIPLQVFILTVLIWGVIFFILSIYDPKRNLRPADELKRVVIGSFLSLLVLAGALYFSYRELSRLLIVYFFISNIGILVGWRIVAYTCLPRLRHNYRHTRRIIIIGATKLAEETVQVIKANAWMGLQFVGVVRDSTQPGDLHIESDLPILGTLEDIDQIVKAKHIDEVIIALPYKDYGKLNQIVLDLLPLPVQVRVAPGYFSLALHRATVDDLGGLMLINLRDPALSGYQRMLKRTMDLIVGSMMTLFALPVMALAALAIKLNSPGPILFKQQRVGENGRLFTMYKFRSMVVDAEAQQQEVIQRNGDNEIIHKVNGDPRITRVGCILRRASLDELPQLLNVLRGEMSLVGPRPELPWLVEKYEPWQRQRFAVPQGITGWWQINGRSDKPMHLNTDDDIHYVQNYSLLLDMRILWKTMSVVIKREGAF